MTLSNDRPGAQRAPGDSLLDAARRSVQWGLNRGTSGNLSERLPVGYLITPSGAALDGLVADDLVVMDPHGGYPRGQRPSSEWRMHHDLYRARPEIGGIVHTHSVHAAALASHGRRIPPFHYMVAVAGGADIPCAPYATFGTQELSDQALRALERRDACLLAHHGVLAVGADPGAALNLALEVEHLAGMYLAACQLGEPPLLDEAEMQRVIERFRHYGGNAAPAREAAASADATES
ncbi:MAG: class II aldolase/adducin family protein [Pseudomonadota bacterium]|nr:class II aldolase/adducin family protein [Pseudomonadota bacterium]